MPIAEEAKTKTDAITISEYLIVLNSGFQQFRAKIIGEVSEAKPNATGHIYFTLKDEKDGSIIKCAMWGFKYKTFGVEIKEGVKIIVGGCPSIHPKYGFSFIADSIELAGEGALKKEYERLKKKLTDEGVFEESRKRPIPKYIQKIGIITSLRVGIVIADFSSNLGKFGFKVTMVDSRVEGQEAVLDLLSSIKSFSKQDIEALVIIRGGGSLESMIAFNNEAIVREIVNFPVPVITGIGHHKDMPLVAMAADLAVSTPSIAATSLTESWKEAIHLVHQCERQILSRFETTINRRKLFISELGSVIREKANAIIERYQQTRNRLHISFRNFSNRLFNIDSQLDRNLSDIYSVFSETIATKKIEIADYSLGNAKGLKFALIQANQILTHFEKSIENSNPERQLKLGYSIAMVDGKIVREIAGLKLKENIDIKLSDGIVSSEIKSINKK